MTEQAKLGGAFTLPGTSMSLHRMGYGAMQLALRCGDRHAMLMLRSTQDEMHSQTD